MIKPELHVSTQIVPTNDAETKTLAVKECVVDGIQTTSFI